MFSEFSRTPLINQNGGRDHLAEAVAVLLAGRDVITTTVDNGFNLVGGDDGGDTGDDQQRRNKKVPKEKKDKPDRRKQRAKRARSRTFKAGSGHSKGIPLRIPSVPPS